MYIEVEHAHKRYEQGGEGFTALRDVSLSIEKGEFICFLGPSGCGKSTLLNAIAGFERLNSGTITIDGKAVEKPEERYVMIFQNYGLLPWRTARANVSLGLEKRERNRAVREQTADHYLELVGLAAQANRFPAQLSGGQQQRIRFAIATMHDPNILILDEPTTGMDVTARRTFWERMDKLAETGKTIIFATHYLEEAQNFAHANFVVGNRFVHIDDLLAVLVLDVALRFADALNEALGDCVTIIGVDKLVFDGGRTRVNNENGVGHDIPSLGVLTTRGNSTKPEAVRPDCCGQLTEFYSRLLRGRDSRVWDCPHTLEIC